MIALAERDIERRNLVVGESQERLIEYNRKINATQTEKTTAFKVSDDKWVVTDRGFDYNVGHTTYKPNLDHYPESLAHQFAKREMGGEGFKFDFKQLEDEFKQAKQRLNLNAKLTSDDLTTVRNQLRREYKFTAGVLNAADKTTLMSETATVWLSDDTLIKQFNSREGQNFDYQEYQFLPDVIYSADNLYSLEVSERLTKLYFFKRINERLYMSVVKHLKDSNELFAESFRSTNDKELKRVKNKYQQMR
ncbi:Uncharacterised protein [Rodentibacter pneumotropicus]|uniref:Phage-Barnase-EndoU-ColicinE5/D-RelE like nuclease 3 domain-containing protein n=1 Tax=Rodentibacter pneumotropicus TaxID=758 RepID=A0A3S4XRW9_9PAST|nr:Uncharacterised protein [Rodentibacter pneumotropicus]